MSLYTYLQNEYKLDSWYRYYPPTFIINNVNKQDLDKYIEEKLQEKMPDLSEEKVVERIHAVDKMRKKYCKYYTDTEFGNAAYYDMAVKSSTLGIENSIKLICEAVKA